MHPSLSVIFFTTASGAGYGLLALVGILAPFGAVSADVRFGLVLLGLALASITVGLLSSLFHLGHKKRAWRALSQWRSSWLSREGVAAIVTYGPAGLFAAAWVFGGKVSMLLGLLAALCATATVYCTAMIYRSLKPVPRWHNAWVVPNYLALALMGGSVWLALVAQLFGPQRGLNILSVGVIAIAAALKLAYWRYIDRQATAATSTPETATGLGVIGKVRLFEAPHTSENYLLKEMGFQIARKHSVKLRRLTMVLGFALPALLSALPLFVSGWPAIGALLVAAPLATVGIFVERWLFFAEAKHAVMLYYGGTLG